MTRPDRDPTEADTAPIPRVEVDTLELPVVVEEPEPARSPRARTEPPPRVVRRDPPARPPSTPARRRPAPPPPPRRTQSRPRIRLVAAALVVALLSGVGVAAVLGISQRTGPGGGAAVTVANMRSFDPAGGSGFRQVRPGVWVTQTYRSATYGNLKPGVGLLLDLGGRRDLSSVTANVATPGITLELRAADSPAPSADGFPVVATKDGAAGETTLSAGDAGAHRYWLLWVPLLAPAGGGYRAELSGITVRG